MRTGWLQRASEEVPVPGDEGDLLVVIAKRWVKKVKGGSVYRVRSYRVTARKQRGLFLKNHEDHGYRIMEHQAIEFGQGVAESIGGRLVILPINHCVQQNYPVITKEEYVLLCMKQTGISQ